MTESVIRAAGILFLDPQGNALFLRRAGDGDAAGQWCTPGGKIEGDETAEQAAIREIKEEIGYTVKPTSMRLHARRIKPAFPCPDSEAMPSAPSLVPGADALPPPPMVDFTTFLVRVPAQFVPTLNEEHDGYVWSNVLEPPEPLHPGVRIALDKLFMDELGIARAMAAGELTSPQRYINMTMWRMRLTGTGRAFRKKQERKDDDGKTIVYDEHVYRPPEFYLNEEFLSRCNGLPVIWLHPKKATLNSKEFSKRIVGTTLLPYIEGDEVWGVTKIYDDEANELLAKDQLSTSPTVVFTELSVNTSLALPDGTWLLIEDKPGLLDHLAICERGVWDKGGEPAGVSNDHLTIKGDSEVPDEKKEEKKPDAAGEGGNDMGVTDAIAKMADALRQDMASHCQRMDAKIDAVADSVKKRDAEEEEKKKADAKAKADAEEEEKKKADAAKKRDGDGTDPEQVAADKKRKDAEEKEKEEKEKADAAKADSVPRSEFEKLQVQIADLSKRVPRAMTSSDRDAFADAQAKADAVLRTHGEHAEPPLSGEELIPYQIRLARKMQPHSKTWKSVDLSVIAADAASFNIALDGIRADALQAGLNPVDLKPFEHRKIVQESPGGHKITSWVGNGTFIKQMSRPVRHVGRIGVRK
jgi:8-oxo-dGTP pyrophosphatase MutT (NUDIX family)